VRTLLEEARIVSKFQHPNIVTLFDAGEHEGSPYPVFEYVEGRTLAELIRQNGKLPAPQAVKLALEVLAGVGYARASTEVLGISYEELGTGAAQKWNFPEQMIKSMRSALCAAARSWDTSEPEPQAPVDAVATLIGETQLDDLDSTQNYGAGGEVAPANRRAVLVAGVQDITNTLVGDFDLNDVLRIILETMVWGIGFTRVLLFVSDVSTITLRCRFGFGTDVEGIIGRGLSIPLAGPKDIFYAATSQAADICIDDLNAEKIRPYVPEWYRKAITARGMVLFPIVVNKRALALIYADADNHAVLRFSPEDLNLLKTLRSQAVLAMKH
jgi:hypothetical protein